jgi:site-specific DNA recombinase
MTIRNVSMKVAIYARLSKDTSGISENVDIQIRECRAYARTLGFQIAGIFSDNDVGASEYSRKPRPGYRTLLAAVRANQVNAILITETPRLYRQLDELLELIHLAKRTSLQHIIAIDEFGYDLSTGQGIHNAISAVHAATLESRRTSDRQRRRIRAKAQDGAGHGGKRPYGYEKGWTALREDEAKVVGWMVGRILAGETINGVVRELNARGIPTATGKEWHHTLVRQILVKPRIAGIRSHNGATYKGSFPGIITVDEWELLQLALAKLRRSWPGGVRGREYLLTGLVYCGNCDQRMTGGAHKSLRETNSKPRYRCSDRPGIKPAGCGKVTRLAQPVDILVTEAVLSMIDTSELSRLLQCDTGQDVKPLLQHYQRLERRKRDLVDDFATGLLTRGELVQARMAVERQIRHVQAQLTQLQPQRAQVPVPAGQTMREAWETGSLAWHRMVLALLIERIVIRPAPPTYTNYHGYRFSPEGIEIIWKYWIASKSCNRQTLASAVQA